MKSKFIRTTSLVLIQALLLQGTLHSGAFAAISDMPPLVASKVAPNIMFTLDNSGSMRWEQMPDEIVGTVGSDNYGYAQPANLYRNGESASGSYTAFETTTTPSIIKARRFRSSAVNKIYYNPAVRYEPWVDANSVVMSPAVTTATKYNPILPTGVVTWPTALNLELPIPSGTFAGAYVATYYNYTGGGSCPASPSKTNVLTAGEVPACYTKVEIKSSVTSYPKSPDRTDCTGATCNYAQEIQNFANWFQYWRSRILIARGGVGKAFAKQGTNIRVGWGAINSAGTVISKVRNDFNTTNRQAFFDFLYAQNYPNGGTPLRQAVDQVGQYFKTTDAAGPWQNTINSVGDTSSGQSTCRQNYNILMTDGYWNGNGAATGRTGDYDGANGTLKTHADGIQTYTYTPVTPYSATQSGTLADIAMYYWREDLRTDMVNNVPVTTADPAFWQHLVHFTVGLGVNGTLDPKTDLPALTSGTKVWPTISADDPTGVDDLWHAALDSHGDYFSASNPKEFADSLDGALKTIDNRVGSAAAVGTSSNTVGVGLKLFTSSYRSDKWSGNLEQKSVDLRGIITATDWDAASKILDNSNASRNIVTSNSTGTGSVNFALSSLTSADQATFNSAAAGYAATPAVTATNLVDYIRGDRKREGVLRIRTSLLGDLVNSDPKYVKEGADGFYSFLPSGSAEKSGGTPTVSNNYDKFSIWKKTRAATVYVGSNDGMLHAFDSATGNEIFAYVPKAVIPNLPNLANPSYTHKFYVDGTPIIGDAFIGGGWKTILLGSTGAGGKSIFALDITNPSATPGSIKVLWERNDITHVNSEASPVPDLGYTIGNPQIGRMKDGRWVAVYGNGYGSTNNKAALYVVDLSNGDLIKRVDTGVGSIAAKNGLSSPKLLIDTDSTILAAYAGDLQGNLWKFNFSTSNPTVAFSGAPLFKAIYNDPLKGAQNQPITTQPQFYPNKNGGYTVMFGTGKIFETGDSTNTDVQSLYGVWDKSDIPNVTATPISGSQSVLQEQRLALSGTDFYTVTDNPVAWASQRGWFINMNVAIGERVVTDSLVIDDQVIFTTIIPGSSTDPCISDGYSTTLQLSPLNGGPLGYRSIDANGDGKIDSADAFVSGRRTSATFGTTVLRKGNGQWSIYQASSSNAGIINKKTCPPGQICGTDSRTGNLVPTVRLWRQILGKQ